MNIGQLVESRQLKVSRIRDSISESENYLAHEEENLARLVDLSSKTSYTIEEINWLIDRQNDF